MRSSPRQLIFCRGGLIQEWLKPFSARALLKRALALGELSFGKAGFIASLTAQSVSFVMAELGADADPFSSTSTPRLRKRNAA